MIDLSTGSAVRIAVNVEGWTQPAKDQYLEILKAMPGVTSVSTSGGGTGFYVFFDPSAVDPNDLERDVYEVGKAVVEEAGLELKPQSAANGSREQSLTFQGEPLSFRSSGVLDEAGEPILLEDGQTNLELENVLGIAPLGSTPIAAGPQGISAEPQTASSWTGIKSAGERAVAVKTVIPIAMAAVETLIQQTELSGHNNGPPLEDRAQALEALRNLHRALGDLLAAVDGPAFLQDAGEGLLAEVARWGVRTCETVKEDPMCYAMSALIFAIGAAVGAPGAGGLLGSMALTIQKNRNG